MNTDKAAVSGSSASHQLRVDMLKQKDDRPNILLIMTDQQRADTIAAGGAGFMKTPNLDRLASEGKLYHNAYSPNPICMPARHNMLTGLPARYHGYADNCWGEGMPQGLPTFPEILSDNGYETRTVGKNHFYPPRRHNGYLNMELMQEVPAFREQDEYLMHLNEAGYGNIMNIHGVRNLLYMVPQQALMPEKHHGTSWAADRTIDFIEKNNGRHPWMLKLGLIAPHPPFNVPEEYADMYSGCELPEPLESETEIAPLAEENKLLGDLPDAAYVRRMRELYYASISHIDHHVGRILDSLAETGQERNTMVIFTSDHGEMLGDYGTFQKWLPYDSCSKIPLIVRFPEKIAAGTFCSDFVDLNDLYPTILEAAGLTYPGSHELPGESLMTKKPSKDRSAQWIEYSEGNRRWTSVRTSRYKYNYYFGGGREELFDLQQDPGETRNILADGIPEGSISEIRNELRVKLTSMEERWGLPGFVENGELVRLPDYEPAPYRNKAFPLFQNKLIKPEERAEMNSMSDEIIEAVRNEPIVRLEDLDLKTWQSNSGFSDDELSRMIERDRRNKQ